MVVVRVRQLEDRPEALSVISGRILHIRGGKTVSKFSLQASRVVAELVIFGSVLVTALAPARAQTQDTSTLTVRITGARNTKGQIGVTLFQDAQGFPDDTSKALRQQSVDIDPSTMSAQVTFKDLPQGTFAVSVLHDENGNGKMDKNFMGMPKEGYGASKNPKKQRRAPTFEGAKFSLNAAQQTIDIKLIY
jgi:uncharacterized protein (DUF2141 family)